MNPKRVLHVIGGMGNGGAEAMIMNLYRRVDRSRIQFDFAVHTALPQLYDREIEALGGRIFRVEKFVGSNYFSYKKWWKNFFREHPERAIVHGHIGSSAAIYLREAKKAGRIAVAHSHNTRDPRRNLHALLWRAASHPTRRIADWFFACSRQAALDRFGPKAADSPRCRVIPNAIDTDRFAFSIEKRNSLRQKLKLDGCFVLGHTGRLTGQKNQGFLLEIFACLYKNNPDARLLLVGDGELEEELRRHSARLGVERAVIFAGLRPDPEDYYAAMDCFCLPSLFEGLPVALIEAQTEGLPSFVSDFITSEADMGAGLFRPISLAKSPEIWAEAIASCAQAPRITDGAAFTKAAGFDVGAVAQELQSFYLSK